MNSGRTVGTFFVRRLIVQRGEIRCMFQGHPNLDPEMLLLLFRELFNTGKKNKKKKRKNKRKSSVLISVFPLFHNTV